MSKGIKLTEKEKLVLYSLVKWPDLNDIELSKKIPVKRPTITAIRNKLKKKNMYEDIVIPNLEMLGCELITVRYGGFNPMAKYASRKKFSSLDKFPWTFYKQSSNDYRISMSASTNFTEAMEYVEYSNIVYGKNELFSDDGIKHMYIPLKLARILKFFDYAPMLKKELGIKIKDEVKPKLDLKKSKVKKRDFSENEKIVLYAIVKYPELNDGEIAKKVGMTRQSVNKMRKRFQKEELIRKIRTPNIKKLGFEVLVAVHFFNNPKYTIEERREGIRNAVSKENGILLVVTNLQTFTIGIQKTFTELKKEYSEFLSTYKKKDFMAKEPVAIIIPTEDLQKSINGRYHPLVKEILGIKKEI